MTKSSILVATELCREFIKRAQVVPYDTESEYHWIKTGKHTAALRRTSMELTKALAEMRKPGY